ncbi:MAG: M23 family metallopeptidase [Defluviitaleaceae bacterium]|nr:M23 family metallopeptidase [Defluviitaleaceae bacterium]MCL2276123.1 M23 family metallopeptidase [Defluviitaleaceae bacterium]
MAKLRRWVRNSNHKLAFGVFILTLILNNFFDFPRLFGVNFLSWIITVVLIIVLNLHFVPSNWAKLKNWVRIKRGISLPDKENYTCKSDYILPFTGKWCVWSGGTTKELSMDWDEPSDRFTYYFVMLDDNGNNYKADNPTIENNLCYGKDVLAVADGVVVKVCNKHSDFFENKEDEFINYAGTWDIVGNHIIIKHSKNEYSCVGNLMFNSITVKVGDKVKQGQSIAKCGNSGYTTALPCLYFNLLSSRSVYQSISLPITFANINATQSTAYNLAHVHEREIRPSTQGNIAVKGNKTYIGRGLDVENIV